jgi:SAM-dependent methyltransferase
MKACEALDRFIAEHPGRVLDIGSGRGEHAIIMRKAGLDVTCVDIGYEPDIRGNYMDVACGLYDSIWCSHVLEHCTNVGDFLAKVRRELDLGGLLCITVPPYRPRLVGGHINLFTEGTLVYNLILAGFDCSKARVGVYGYNISVLVRNLPAILPDDLAYDKGDIERLAKFFPWPVHQAIDGHLGSVRW